MAIIHPVYTLNLPSVFTTGSGAVSGSALLLINEDFTTQPLANDGAPYYDDGCDYNQGTFPGGSPCLQTVWTEGDTGGVGLDSWRAHFLYDNEAGNYAPQSEFEFEFDFYCSENWADQNPGGNTSCHIWYLRTNLDGLYGDNTTIYLEPDGDGEWWVDLNKSDEPSTWQEIRPTTSVNTYDGETHHIKMYLQSNTFGEADGTIKVWVDDIQIINRTNVEIFIYQNQHVQNLSYGPYILGGNAASGSLVQQIDNVIIRGLTPYIEAGMPGTLSFSSTAYNVAESAGTATITVQRSGGSDGIVEVTATTSDGTATGGVDYTPVSTNLVFADGETSKTFTVTIADDEVVENTETINLTLSNPTNGAVLGTASAVLTVLDSFENTLVLDNPVVCWARDYITFTVYNPNAETLGFDYATADLGSGSGYAEAGTEYTSTSGSSSIDPGEKIRISVPINYASIPASGRDVMSMVVTDENENEVTATGVILDALYENDYDLDHPSFGPAEKWGLSRSVGQTSMTTARCQVRAGAIYDNTTAGTGVTSIKHDVRDFDGREFSSGLESLSGTNWSTYGSSHDGEEYYFRVWMKIDPTFDWDSDFASGEGGGGNQEKAKYGRISRVGSGAYTTMYLKKDRLYFSRSLPTAQDQNLNMFYDFDPSTNSVVQDWFELIFYQKRETAFGANNAIARLYINGVLEHEELNTNFMNQNGSDPGDTDVRCGSAGLFTWTQQQIATPSENKGGYIWTCGHVGTQGIWPSAKYPVPS